MRLILSVVIPLTLLERLQCRVFVPKACRRRRHPHETACTANRTHIFPPRLAMARLPFPASNSCIPSHLNTEGAHGG